MVRLDVGKRRWWWGCDNCSRQGRAGANFGCLIFPRSCGTRFRVPPRSRDTLSRGFLIEEEITHAKAAKDAKEDWLLVVGDWG